MAIHAVYEMFNKESTEAVLMVNASNPFNTINREAFLHNTKILCPSISTYINNCYLSPTDLYIQGVRCIKSEERTTKSDPTAMVISALCITPLLEWLSKKSNEGNSAPASKKLAFADDLNGIGTVESLKKWWSLLEEEGKKNGYNVNVKRIYTSSQKSSIKTKQKKSSKIQTLKYRQKPIDISVRLLEANHLVKIIFHL